MKLQDFYRLTRGSHVIWRMTGEHGIVLSRKRDVAWVRWDSLSEEKLVAGDDAYFLDQITEKMRQKLEKAVRIAKYRAAMCQLRPSEDIPVAEQVEILARIKQASEEKKRIEGARVAITYDYEMEGQDDDE